MLGREEIHQEIDNKLKDKLLLMPDYMTNFYYHLSSAGKSAKTKYQYILMVDRFLQFAESKNFDIEDPYDFNRVKPSLINEFAVSLQSREECITARKNPKSHQTSSAYQASAMYSIKAFFNFLYEDEYIEGLPTLKFKMPKIDKPEEIVYLTHEEIAKLKQVIGDEPNELLRFRDKAIIFLGLYTGMRVSEIVELNLSDIDWENNCIVIIGKGNKRRYVYLNDDCISILNEWIEYRRKMLRIHHISDPDALFLSNRKTRLTAAMIRKLVAKYTERAGHQVSPHKLRSTFATNILNNTSDIQLTANLMGHSDISTTKRYAKVDVKREREAIARLTY